MRKIVVIILFDQITKALAPRDFLVRNYGLPFGFDFGNLNTFILILSAVLLLGYFFKARKHLEAKSSFAFILIFSGAISNLIDRIIYGYVRDYLNLGITTLNLADLFIFTGIGLLLFHHPQDK